MPETPAEIDVRDPLDPGMERLLRMVETADQPRIVDLDPPAARAWADRMFGAPDPPRPLALVEDRIIDGPAGDLPCRLYHPSPGTPCPLLVHFHGGGWVLGSLDQADDVCRRLAGDGRIAVLSVDYRLAPEHPYPAAIEDAQAAVRHVLRHAAEFEAMPDRIGVSGDSAGGHLAAIAAQTVRDDGHEPGLALQYLIYPVTDCDFERPSMIANATGRLLETAGMSWFWDHFCPDHARRTDWTASPIRRDSLTGVAPAVVALAAHDPLYSEGIAYARRLEEAGVVTTVRIARDLIHGYFGLTTASERADAEVGLLNRLVGASLNA